MIKKTIAFDLDGTLIDVSLRDFQIYSDLVIWLGGQPMPYEKYWPLRRRKTDIHKILYDSEISGDDLIEVFLRERGNRMEEPRYLRLDTTFPNVVNFLSDLSSKYNVCILTKRYNKINTRNQLHALGLADFKCYITESDKGKVMLEIPNLYMMAGDTESDIVPAKQMGIVSVAVLSGIRDLSLMIKMSPTYILDYVTDISKIEL